MFKVLKKSKISSARLGLLSTPHGKIKTPAFFPDATRGIIKTLSNRDLESLGLESAVINTFHLHNQPGIKIIKKAKGIHNFINWKGPLISDSGGFQVFSLLHKNPKLGKILDKYAEFKSPIDGSLLKLSPEKSISIQFDLGTDLIVCLDDCSPYDHNIEKITKSVKRTIVWAKRCKKEYEKQITKRKLTNTQKPKIIAVVQGGEDIQLRQYCAKELISIGFDGYGFGGRPVDAKNNFLDSIIGETAKVTPDNKFRFALGVGQPEDITKCVKMGWDLFDCVIPTREGRHGKLFFHNPKKNNKNFYKTINIKNSIFKNDLTPINKNSQVAELKNNSKAYLHHLFKVNEPVGQRLASLNNLEFYLIFISSLRESIKLNLL